MPSPSLWYNVKVNGTCKTVAQQQAWCKAGHKRQALCKTAMAFSVGPTSAGFATPVSLGHTSLIAPPSCSRPRNLPSPRTHRTRNVTTRMVLANDPKSTKPVAASTLTSKRYVGTPPAPRRGRLRIDFERYLSEDEIIASREPVSTDAERYQWSSGGYNRLTRSTAIWAFIGRLLAINWLNGKRWSYWMFEMSDERVRARRRALAASARESILNFGPTFIKVGQLAAARADIFPSEVIEELSALQDRVPGFSWRSAEAILEKEYGKPLDEVFSYFDKEPIAAASLGQVHRAGLPSGEDVVVKIQRPGLKELFDLDLEALRVVAEYLQNSKRYGGNTRDWVGIYEECQKVLYQEIDYVLEARNCERFRENFKDVEYVRIPKAYMDYTTERVLCLQYVPGISIRNREAMLRAGIDPALVAKRSGTILLKQILDYAFFTADPHAGNSAISPQLNGTIILYDFGMVGVLNPNIKERLVDILIGVIEKDADVVMNTLVELGALVLPPDPVPVRRSIQFFLDSIGSRPNRDQTVAAIGDDLYATAYDKPFRLPAESVFLLRALSTLEGVNKTLDPDFKFSEIAQPFADEILQSRGRGVEALNSPAGLLRSLASSAVTGETDPVTRQLQKRLANTSSNAVQAADRIEKIEKTLSQLENGDLKVRARATETERLLRKQYSLSQASNYLVAAATTGVLAVQVFSAGSAEGAGALASLSALMGAAYVRKTSKLDKDIFSSNNDSK